MTHHLPFRLTARSQNNEILRVQDRMLALSEWKEIYGHAYPHPGMKRNVKPDAAKQLRALGFEIDLRKGRYTLEVLDPQPKPQPAEEFKMRVPEPMTLNLDQLEELTFDDMFPKAALPKGYHLATIPRGVYGDSSKIMEEVLELEDAEAQGAKVMALNELADIIGAVEGYLNKHFSGITLADLIKMKELTAKAFQDGTRK